MLRFLGARADPRRRAGARRRLPPHRARRRRSTGWLAVTRPHARPRRAARATISLSLSRRADAAASRGCGGCSISTRSRRRSPRTWRAIRCSAPRVQARPGLRVPGAFDGFEAAVRAVLGQQVSVAAATTLAGRLAARFGEPIATPHAELTRLVPDAPTASPPPPDDAIAALGISGSARADARHAGARGRRRRAGARRAPARSASASIDAARRAARHRSVDRALPRDARVRLAGRVPGERSRRARRRSAACRAPQARALAERVAPLARLRRHAPVDDRRSSTRAP